ncbi:MAG: succinylglutamate desuccinylase/aspartoacylase family protein [Planctomycetota bacterium]|nr:succinylglutamate desuccinylase/aspartoacylase family protein [Planctomycetota bacterium]
MKKKRAPFVIAETEIKPGTRKRIEIPIARLPTQDTLSLPINVLHGLGEGPTIWLSAAVHGDEINGIEIIRRVLGKLKARGLNGTILAVPVVNVFGFLDQKRALPDGRDLNRSFPGSPKGSLTARLAHLFVTEIVARCQYGLDFHTGARHRSNLPQLRLDFEQEGALECARAFDPPFILAAGTRDGSLRAHACKKGATTLLFEGGEALRFDEEVIQVAVTGTLNVLEHLGMIPKEERERGSPIESVKSSWVRARRGGLFRPEVKLGDHVTAKSVIGYIADVYGKTQRTVKAPFSGIVMGLLLNPLVYQGDAVIHLARFQGKETKAG